MAVLAARLVGKHSAELHGVGKLPVVEHRSSKLHHFQDLGQHIHIVLPQNAGEPFWTLEQAIIRQLRRGQESRTRGQVPAGILPHSGYDEAAEA